MERPELDKVWHTFVKLSPDGLRVGEHIEVLRFKIRPVLMDLKKNGMIKWYCFLIHSKRSGVPAHLDDGIYIHVRMGLYDNSRSAGLLAALPDYFVGTEHVPLSNLVSIAGIDEALLKGNTIEEAWRIIGEQCEWLLDLLSIYEETASVFPNQIAQFFHYFSNITQLAVQ